MNPDQATEQQEAEALPRFLVATQQYEAFLEAKARELEGSDVERTQSLYNLMVACGGLTGAAQTYDFVIASPSLSGSEAVASTGRALATMLSEPSIPPEVRDIYQGLYGEELRQYAAPDGA